MKTVDFKCKCGEEFDVFRLGNERLEKWKKGEEIDKEVKCPKCGNTDRNSIETIIAKGSGQFQKFPVFGPSL